MWAQLRAPKTAKDGEKLSTIHHSNNVNDEYHKALRTESYVKFFAKAQLLVSEPSPCSCKNAMEILLEPEQDVVPSILEKMVFPEALSDLKSLVFSYFDTSADASKICSHLLKNINQTYFNQKIIQKAFEKLDDYSPEQFKLAISELDSFSLLSNPFSNPNQHDFKLIHDRYSSILNSLRLKKKKVARRIKLIDYISKASGIFLTVACGVVALVAISIAVHSLSGLLMGPALLGISSLHLKKKLSNIRYFRCRFLRKLGEQLDVAAKGTYTLSRDFDTMGRLVARLHDEVEHNKTMIGICLEREDKFLLREFVKELKKRNHGFNRQVEELEEQVCLCLATINRARVLVIKEMSTS